MRGVKITTFKRLITDAVDKGVYTEDINQFLEDKDVINISVQCYNNAKNEEWCLYTIVYIDDTNDAEHLYTLSKAIC